MLEGVSNELRQQRLAVCGILHDPCCSLHQELAAVFKGVPRNIPVHLEIARSASVHMVPVLNHAALPTWSSLRRFTRAFFPMSTPLVSTSRSSPLSLSQTTVHLGSLYCWLRTQLCRHTLLDSIKARTGREARRYDQRHDSLASQRVCAPWLLRSAHVPRQGATRLTRIHFHSLIYHAIGTRPSGLRLIIFLAVMTRAQVSGVPPPLPLPLGALLPPPEPASCRLSLYGRQSRARLSLLMAAVRRI